MSKKAYSYIRFSTVGNPYLVGAWAKQQSYDGTGTIWQWGSPSVSFGHRSYSMFYVVLGMPKSFSRYLNVEIRILGKHVRPNSDEVIPSLADGWDVSH
jgi:hypothetical protein